MTDNKLTLADWYKYYEADVQFTTDDNTIQRGYVRAIQVHSDTELEIECFPISFYHKAVSDCKLILRGITQLTDEEKKYINDNLFYDLFKNTVSLNANAIWNSFDELLAVCEDKTALIDYLRGNNILIEPEDWFKSGKAVKDDK